MAKQTSIVPMVVIFIIVCTFAFLVSGCSGSTNTPPANSNNNAPANTNVHADTNTTRRGMYNQSGRMMNLTPEQRQQMIDQRQQVAVDACQGMTEGQACTLTSPRGDRTGTCQMQQDKVMCVLPGFNRTGPPPNTQ